MRIIKNKSIEATKANAKDILVLVSNDYICSESEEDFYDNYYIELLRVLKVINYRKQRDIYKYLIEFFNEQPVNIKDNICRFCATNTDSQINTVIIPYYVSKGMTVNEAISTYRKNRSIDILKAASDCKVYAESPKLIEILFEYLAPVEVERFVDETIDLIDKYTKFAIYGKNYGNYKDGLLDFIESTNKYSETGLVSYILNYDKELSELVVKIKEVLIDGKIN